MKVSWKNVLHLLQGVANLRKFIIFSSDVVWWTFHMWYVDNFC